ncbi:MAG: permease [Candidatus Marinimicrobia bacterium]|nr:permease [Candidatus Neomarinimicrobiota bacterium]
MKVKDLQNIPAVKRKKKGKQMLVPTIIMASIALILVFIGYRKGGSLHITGMQSALTMTIQVLPLLIFAFIVAGMIQALLPQDLLNRWVGAESGLRGILIGTIAGGLTPGGPYVSYPVIAGLLKSGAGTMVAFLTSWSLWAVARLPMEVGILGWKFTLIRLSSTFFFPPIAGLIAQTFFANFNR